MQSQSIIKEVKNTEMDASLNTVVVIEAVQEEAKIEVEAEEKIR